MFKKEKQGITKKPMLFVGSFRHFQADISGRIFPLQPFIAGNSPNWWARGSRRIPKKPEHLIHQKLNATES